MGISAIGGAPAPVLQQAQRVAHERPAVAASAGGDSDGDNDGSKGGTVDVRA
jgi:hypothetical protein